MFELQIKTTPETKQLLKKTPSAIRKALIGGMNKAGPFLESTVKKSFGTGSYPKVRTGHLRRSIYNKIIEKNQNIIGVVGTNVIYGRFLEEGTKRMKARPFLRPAVELNQDKLAAMINDHIIKELNK